MAARNLAQWLLLAAAPTEARQGAEPSPRPLIRAGDRAWTWAELDDQTRRVAAALAALGLAPGERVAVFMRDTLEAAASILGIIFAGGVAVPLSELATPDDVQQYLVHATAVIAIVEGGLEPTLDQVRVNTPALREILCLGTGSAGERDWHAAVAAATRMRAPAARTMDDPCVLLYSAGGGPAGGAGAGLDALYAVPHSPRTIEAACSAFAEKMLGMSAADRVLSMARLSTAYGLGGGLFFPLATGAQTILVPEQPRSEVLFAVIEREEPTMFFATPSVYSQMAYDAVRLGLNLPLTQLRVAIAGAEGVPEDLIPKVRKELGTELTVGYGLTEIFQFALAGRSTDEGSRAGTCGRPLDGVEVRLTDDDGKQVGIDEIGTLELRCAALLDRYWGQAEPARSGDGWFTTKDRFLVDGQGLYHHCGRVDDLFKVSGKWVSPAEVERALTAHEAVWECAVIGVDDEDGLIKPLAIVVPNVGHVGSPTLEGELREYIKHTLAPYKYPRWIEFVDVLPRGPGGKLLRYKLRPARRRRRAETGH